MCRHDRPRDGNPQTRGALPIRAALNFFTSLRDEAVREAERIGPMRGPICPQQRTWSYVLDAIDAELQVTTEGNAA